MLPYVYMCVCVCVCVCVYIYIYITIYILYSIYIYIYICYLGNTFCKIKRNIRSLLWYIKTNIISIKFSKFIELGYIHKLGIHYNSWKEWRCGGGGASVRSGHTGYAQTRSCSVVVVSRSGRCTVSACASFLHAEALLPLLLFCLCVCMFLL